MNLDFLSGALAAWAVAYSSVALFFLLAHFWARQQREYLLFGLLLFALAVMSAGIALIFQPQGAPPHLLGNRVAMTGALLAVSFQLQFALRYSARSRPWYVWPPFVVALGMLVWTWSVSWHVSATPQEPNVLLMRLHPNLGTAFSTFVLTGVVLSAVLLLDTYRRGKLEAVLLLVAVGLVGAACVHDVFVLHTRLRRASEFVSPHVLWVYVVAMAATLLLHYRGAEGRLAEAASSLRARTEELRRSHAELEKVQSELVRKEQLAAVGELAASIAHEVRNPLAVIVNANAGLRRGTLNTEDRETLLSIIDEETERLNRLVEELLRFARPVSARRSAVSLVELCEDVRKNAPPGHEVTAEIPDDPTIETIWVDPTLFRVVLDNLVGNACQSMSPGGAVGIKVRQGTFEDGRDATVIEVVDQGHGMDTPVLQRALHPFFTTRPSGTGLGLPIVQRFVEAHGGDLCLTSHLGSGTTATLRIPRSVPVGGGAHEPRIPVELTVNEEPLG